MIWLYWHNWWGVTHIFQIFGKNFSEFLIIKLLIQENEFENVVCRMADISSRLQRVSKYQTIITISLIRIYTHDLRSVVCLNIGVLGRISQHTGKHDSLTRPPYKREAMNDYTYQRTHKNGVALWVPQIFIWKWITLSDCKHTKWVIWTTLLDSKVHGANMGPIWGRQEPGGPDNGPMNFAIWVPLYFGLFFPQFSRILQY